MCGIAGQLNLTAAEPPRESTLRGMLGQIRHRGPDEFGLYLAADVSLGSARLSIVDLAGGQQPIANEDETLWIVFNGEIFNHVELRRELEARGHRFATHTDTEVILHLFEDCGPRCLDQLNGQFALAIWNERERTLFLARDRLGVRPLFYTEAGGRLSFGSEIKALLADPANAASIDPSALAQVFQFWSPVGDRTAFLGIRQLLPGHWMTVRSGHIEVRPYWQMDFPDDSRQRSRDADTVVGEFRDLLVDATRLRLRADVPVGAYLSGGLDSSTIAAIVRQSGSSHLDTFSIAFDDAQFDESSFQREMAAHLGTDHHVVRATHADIGQAFPDVIWHTEVPVMRTAPAPMFLLSRLVRKHGFKVVLTGEGADEFLGGYDIFKEALIRRFWAREPGSRHRPRLFQRLYRDIPGFGAGNEEFLAAFFREHLTDTANPYYSHLIRWKNNRRTCRFLSDDVLRAAASGHVEAARDVELPAAFSRWDSLQQAQYLEIALFLSNYLLCSQGDRMGMAHSVEGRFPFLDHRVVSFCNRLPARLKIRGLTEKHLLKRAAAAWLPRGIAERPKRPYRAPIHASFFPATPLPYVEEVLSDASLRDSGLFKPVAVRQLVQRVRQGARLGETDDMALAGIISTQLVHAQFVRGFATRQPVHDAEKVKVYRRHPAHSSFA